MPAIPGGAQGALGLGTGNAVRFVLKLPRALVRQAPATAASAAALSAAFPVAATPTPFGTPTPFAAASGPPPAGAIPAAIASVKLAIAASGSRATQNAVINVANPSTCAGSGPQLQCTLAQGLSPGTYSAAVTFYSAPNAVGTALGNTQVLGFAVGAQHTNVVPMAVGVPPAGIAVAGTTLGVHGTQNSGFTLYGTASQSFSAIAVDGFGDAIVGPGSPSFSAVITAGPSGGGAWQLSQTALGANVLALSPPSSAISSATIQVTANYTDSTCVQPGAVCTASFSVTNDLQMLFVANCTSNCNGKASNGSSGSVTAYAPPYTGAPAATILNGVAQPIALLADSALNLFVANAFGGRNGTGSVTIYAPPYTGAPSTIEAGISNPGALAMDANGDLWVANQGRNGVSGTLTEYAPPYANAPVRTISNFAGVPTSVGLDAQNDLFVANGNALFEYVPPYNGTPITIATGIAVANGFAFDAAGDLFYVDSNGGVAVYAPPYNAPPAQLPRVNGTLGLLAAYPSGGLVFVPDGAGNIQEFVAPYTGPPQAIPASNPNARGIAVDGAGNVFVGYCGTGCGNNGADSVTIYSPPYTGTPATITTNVSAPSAITLTK